MTPNLMARLARVEGQAASPPALANAFTPGIRLLWLLLAVHVGELQSRESIAEGVARALGYGWAGEMRAAMQAEGTSFIEWNTRHGVAMALLLNERSGGASAGMNCDEAAIRSLVSDMPEKFQAHPSITDAEAAIRLATEWVSL